MDESAPVGVLQDETVEEITGETYGPLKALCEHAVEKAFQGRAFQVRAGLIVGPYDPTDRFTYWPVRVARGGEVLVPGLPETLIQFVDVRDLADWIVRMAEARQPGVFNATGPENPLSMDAFLTACREIADSDASLTWLPAEFLLEQRVAPWSELPLWIPESDPDAPGFSTVNCRKAISAGLEFKPLAETLQDTLAWAQTRPVDWTWRAGLSSERETTLLKAWHVQG
jgi:2'-hydroxyisoflavone reductase